MSKPDVTMTLVIDNTAEPCNLCHKHEGHCECTCAFCKRLKRHCPDKMLIAGAKALICKDCVRNAKEMMR